MGDPFGTVEKMARDIRLIKAFLAGEVSAEELCPPMPPVPKPLAEGVTPPADRLPPVVGFDASGDPELEQVAADFKDGRLKVAKDV